MLQRIFASALGAGLVVGLIVAIIQHVTLVPLILTAELYEDGKLTVQRKQTQAPPTDIGAQVALALPAVVGKAQAHDAHPAAANATEESPWRAVFTFIATTLTGVGFALLLVGAYAVSGRKVDAREGLLWGIAGF